MISFSELVLNSLIACCRRRWIKSCSVSAAAVVLSSQAASLMSDVPNYCGGTRSVCFQMGTMNITVSESAGPPWPQENLRTEGFEPRPQPSEQPAAVSEDVRRVREKGRAAHMSQGTTKRDSFVSDRRSQNREPHEATGPRPAVPKSETWVCPVPPEQESGRYRFYIVWLAKNDCHLEGLWHCPWPHLEAQLPGSRLVGSGVNLKGFDDMEKATNFWAQRNGTRKCINRTAK